MVAKTGYDAKCRDQRSKKVRSQEIELVLEKFPAMLWNTGIHSMANGGRKLCENDQDNFIIIMNCKMTMR